MMRDRYKNVGLRRLCGLFGRTRSAFYESGKREIVQQEQETIVLDLVKILRRELPRIGTRKLLYLLHPTFDREGIKMGRDRLHGLLHRNRLLVRRRKPRPKTTWSKHWMKKWTNLIRDLVPDAPHQLWVSDITYLSLKRGDFVYLSLITDAYSHKVVGWHLSRGMTTEAGPLKALEMALKQLPERAKGLIHHSDRGSQYCSDVYVKTLQQRGISISMTEKKDPYENAIAERLNGILKQEFELGQKFESYQSALKATQNGAQLYNTKWPHGSCDYFTPGQAHQRTGLLINPDRRRKISSKPSKD